MTIFSFQKNLKTLPTVEDLQTALDSLGAWVTTPGQELVVYTNVLLPTQFTYFLHYLTVLIKIITSKTSIRKKHFQIEVDYSFSLWLYSNFRSH